MNLAPRLPPRSAATIHQFLRSHVSQAHAEGVVVGLSGGIDSAVTAQLARDALGAGRVFGVQLPDAEFPPALLAETEAFAAARGIGHRLVSIGPAEEAIRRLLPEVHDRISLGNLRARLRMIVLYTIARERHALVAGTGNKSEILLGYFTKYGDGGVDLLPIGDLYKTDVRALARELHIPDAIQQRAPSAGFWEGQTDEEEIGLPYATLDPILHGLEELREPVDIASELGVPVEVVERIGTRVMENRHKRRLPPIPKLRLRTVGIDWRD
jgi:NAD+ synthase